MIIKLVEHNFKGPDYKKYTTIIEGPTLFLICIIVVLCMLIEIYIIFLFYDLVVNLLFK